MEISTQKQEAFLVVAVTGRLDAVTTPDFEKRCTGLIEEGNHKIIINFMGLEYISSAGLRSILTIAKKLRALNGTLALCNLSGMVREVIALSGFDSFLPVYDNAESAIKANS